MPSVGNACGPTNPSCVAYSNTVSSVQWDVDYATLDLGYDFFRGAGYKLGAFVGYYYIEKTRARTAVRRSLTSYLIARPQFPARFSASRKMTDGNRCASGSTAT